MAPPRRGGGGFISHFHNNSFGKKGALPNLETKGPLSAQLASFFLLFMNHGGVYKKKKKKEEDEHGRKTEVGKGEMNKKALSYGLHGGHT